MAPMRARPFIGIAALTLNLWAVGCNQNRMLTTQPTTTNGWQQLPPQPYPPQVPDLGQRASALDADNRDLHAQLARSEQQVQLLKEQVELLQGRLGETANQLREMQVAKQDVEKQVETFQTSTLRGGGAILKANNSLQDSLGLIHIPGAEVRQDGDVIRIELPADQLFQPGTSQLLPSAYNLLDLVANAITRAYPKQVVGIEGYTDNSALNGAGSHQLTASQAVAVLDVLQRRNHLPANQLFSVGQGANHPRVSNATAEGRAKNRRLEVVIYPETFGPN